ncbi:uncharacterized protein LOC122533439 [Frieseomelitta varia]|uniref:uncharacterized protein LOC122533439 n=1 Tax=Frieseomelitta varia TaxID=561572 RepID=UPI001CB69157|nr:uncharacterized protein LOC122533439 [Frieseomelitta varia]
MNSEFGNFQETYDWIECKSIQFPGKVYFFNLRTRYSTWFRPVPRDVQLQHYDKKPKTYNNDFASDVDNSIILSSEDEKKSDNYMNNKKVVNKKHVITRKVKKKMYKKGTCENSKIFTRSPYELRPTTAINYSNNNEYFDNMNCISKDLHIKNNYSKLQDFCFREKGIYNHFNKSIVLNSHKSSILENKMIVIKKNEQSPNKNDNFISTLNVQNITSSCLLKEKSQKNQNAKKCKETQLKESKLESSKIIGEMYDKVNYDSVKLKLPPGVKITKLSDSSTTLSSWHDGDRNVQLAVPNNFEIPNANLHINLSESDSSSTSCSCSTCSTSSDTNSTSSSDISEKK